MKPRIAKIVLKRKRILQKRLAKTSQPAQPGPMLNPGPIEYDVADRNAGMVYGGIGAVHLLIRATELEYQFMVQQEGGKAELIATAFTKNLSTEVIGGFTGVFIGMYASGNGKENQNPADFDRFDLEHD